MHTLDHLAGVANRAAIHYTGESQLREVQKHSLYFRYHYGLPSQQLHNEGEVQSSSL